MKLGAIGISLIIWVSVILNVIDKMPRLDCCGCHCHRNRDSKYGKRDMLEDSDNDSVKSKKSAKMPDTARTHVSDLLISTDVV